MERAVSVEQQLRERLAGLADRAGPPPDLVEAALRAGRVRRTVARLRHRLAVVTGVVALGATATLVAPALDASTPGSTASLAARATPPATEPRESPDDVLPGVSKAELRANLATVTLMQDLSKRLRLRALDRPSDASAVLCCGVPPADPAFQLLSRRDEAVQLISLRPTRRTLTAVTATSRWFLARTANPDLIATITFTVALEPGGWRVTSVGTASTRAFVPGEVVGGGLGELIR